MVAPTTVDDVNFTPWRWVKSFAMREDNILPYDLIETFIVVYFQI